MPITLFKLHAYPDDVAVTKSSDFVEGSAFLLDFSRPVEVRRWLGFRNSWVGVPVALLVPVIHEGQVEGGYVIAVHRDDPYFNDVRAMWRSRYPTRKAAPQIVADGLKVIADFARQFPEDSATP